MSVVLTPLPDMSEVDVTRPVFRAAIVTAGRFVAKARLTDLVVLGAGHRHFTVRAHEALREEADASSHLFTTSVVSLDDVSADQEVAWRFTDTGEWVPTIWSADSKGVNVQSARFQSALAEVGAFLAAEKLHHTLVMKVLGSSIPLGEGQVLREFTNTKARVQLTVADEMQPGEERYAAAWSFTPRGRPVLRETCWCITHKH